MDLRQLQTLLVVAQVGSLRKAALRLRIAETALSRQIRLLEEELRTPLFDRHGRGLTPTSAGRHFIERVQPMLADLDKLKAEMLSRRNAISGKVTIGIPWLLLDTLADRLATGFIPKHPGVNIRFAGGSSGQVQRMLQAGDLDVALFFEVRPTGNPALMPLFEERLLLVGDRACGYRQDRPLPFRHLADVPLALPEAGDAFRHHVEAVARKLGIALNIRFEVSALQPLKALAVNGLAQVFASLHAVRADLQAGRLSAAPIADPPIVRTLMLGMSEERAVLPVARRLARAAREEIAMLVADGSFLTVSATRRPR